MGERTVIVVGDRVLVRPEEGDSVTNAGLILPATVADREAVQAGRVILVGPGHAFPSASLDVDEDWRKDRVEPRYVAMQARLGDLAIFYRKAAVEVTVDNEKLIVVSHAAILLLLRDDAALSAAERSVN